MNNAMNKTKFFPNWIKAAALVLMFGLMVSGIMSCQLREINAPDDQAHITLEVDWSLMDKEPTGMTVMFYPTDGTNPYKLITNEVHYVHQDLPEKDYDILIFNQSVEEFTTLNFSGLEKFDSAEVFIPETKDLINRVDRLYNEETRGYNSTAKVKPRSFASETTKSTQRSTRGYNSTAKVKPRPRVGQLKATVHVRGLENTLRVNGALTGLAGGGKLASSKLNNTKLIQELDNWNIALTRSSDGTITTEFGTFGISPAVDYSTKATTTSNAMANVEESEEDDYRNILYLNFLLKDYTYVSYRFDVTNKIKDYSTEAEVELVLDLGTEAEEYIDLPNTGFPYKNTPVSVSPWSDKIVDHNVILE